MVSWGPLSSAWVVRFERDHDRGAAAVPFTYRHADLFKGFPVPRFIARVVNRGKRVFRMI